MERAGDEDVAVVEVPFNIRTNPKNANPKVQKVMKVTLEVRLPQ